MTITSHNKKVTKVSPAGRILAKDRSQAGIDLHKQRLKNSKKVQSIEPYVVLKYGNQKWTSHVSKGLDPTFEGERAICTFKYIQKKQIKIYV